MRKKIVIGMLCLNTILVSSSIWSQTVSKIKGVVFADYYYNFQNHDELVQDQNAFQLRRAYFTFENNLTKDIKIRFRLESAHSNYGSTNKINPFVKHAYLEWKNLIPSHKVYIGIGETNAFKNAEALWSYRSIEKTIMDLNKISSSADMGLAIKGDLNDKVHHWLTIMNGTGYGSSEVDEYKKIGYSFWVTPVQGLILEAYGDYEKQDPKTGTFKYAKEDHQSTAYYTLKGFVGYDAPRYSIGAEYFTRNNKESGLKMDANADVVKTGYSIFGSVILPVPKLKAFLRYDHFDPNSDDDVLGSALGKDDETDLIIAGFDYIPKGNIHFMPNIIYKSYASSGKDADIMGRITMYIKFDTGKIITQ